MPFLQDDLIEIKCYVCGDVISSGPNMGFNTAKCVKCQRGDTIVEEAKPLELQEPVEKNTVEKVIDTIIETTDKVVKKVKSKVKKSDSKLNLK